MKIENRQQFLIVLTTAQASFVGRQAGGFWRDLFS